jgi:HJR/Mrr/RecB family endonuclease
VKSALVYHGIWLPTWDAFYRDPCPLFSLILTSNSQGRLELTPKSGDQGVDIVAEKNSIRVALQCKRYANAVGNAAVQEIYSGKKFVNAQYGVVVSNAPFTPAAIELATSTNIKLIHHNDLSKLDEIIASLK